MRNKVAKRRRDTRPLIRRIFVFDLHYALGIVASARSCFHLHVGELVFKVPLLACVGQSFRVGVEKECGIRSLGMSWTDNAPGVREVCMSHPDQWRRTRPRRRTDSTQAPAPQGGLRRSASADARVLHRDGSSPPPRPWSPRRDEVSRFLDHVSMEGLRLQVPARLRSAEQTRRCVWARLTGVARTHAGDLDRVEGIFLAVSPQYRQPHLPSPSNGGQGRP